MSSIDKKFLFSKTKFWAWKYNYLQPLWIEIYRYMTVPSICFSILTSIYSRLVEIIANIQCTNFRWKNSTMIGNTITIVSMNWNNENMESILIIDSFYPHSFHRIKAINFKLMQLFQSITLNNIFLVFYNVLHL